jgi:hypothetical protein
MTNQGLLRTGIIDTVIAPICCFSPILIIRLGAVGSRRWLRGSITCCAPHSSCLQESPSRR